METKKITYGKLQDVLLRLGYAPTNRHDHGVFCHPKTRPPVILPRIQCRTVLKPINLFSVQNSLANGGIVPKGRFDSLFQMGPIDLWHAIIDPEAEYRSEHGHPAHVLKLPILQAYDLAKLRGITPA
jgi:hypothetical protein